MTRDADILRIWIMAMLCLAAVCVNSVPAIYMFCPWRNTWLGKLFMLQAISFAFAIDVSVLFQFWKPADILLVFWTVIILYTLIAVSTSALAVFIWRLNSVGRKKVEIVKFTSPVYDGLKNIAQVWLPGAGALYFAVAQIWGLPSAEEVVGTIVAIDTFLGTVLKISSNTYNNTEKFGGTLALTEGEDSTTLRLKDVDPVALSSRPEITFKIVKE